MRPRARAALCGLLLAVLPLVALAQQGTRTPNPQQQLTESQRRLQEIRAERQQLRNELTRLRGQARTVAGELALLRRQATVSQRLVSELNFQLGAVQTKIDSTSSEIVSTQLELQDKRQLLNRRLRDLYKRGPLHSVEVLLSSRSFADLLNRYKYLHLVTQRDRALVTQVAELNRQLTLREYELRRDYTDLSYLQTERTREHRELQQLASERGGTLVSLREHEESTTSRLNELARDERRLTDLISGLETRRREAERRASAPAAPGGARPNAPAARPAAGSTMTTADLGNLAWPADGRLAYRFGRAAQANGTFIRYNGVGIATAAGTPVRAVEAGTVEMAAPFEGYGPTVVVSHGGGYYSLYLYLRDVSVQRGAQVTRGQVVGTVGGEHTPEGAHLEFQIRAPGGQAVDPLTWLRGRAR
jgi:murein hydrolase activator